MGTGTVAPLVGRERERQELIAALAGSRARSGEILVIEGEPGIGKSRLLLELSQIASSEACGVLIARASEFERDLPYALWNDAIDTRLRELGERRIRLLGVADPRALALVTPALAGQRDTDGSVADRHRIHRAMRDLLERLAGARPLVLCIDDVHWADPASVDALAALVRRPPAAPVLVALTTREAQLPSSLARAVAAAMVDGRVLSLDLRPLTKAEAQRLVGVDVSSIFPLSGGNPFYLQQLALAPARTTPESPPVGGLVPAAVAASLASELGQLSASTRLLLQAAAVVGDPFEPELAAEVAELTEMAALEALDDLLARTLVRPTGAARRFAFRHPLVRHAVYEGSAGGWRLGAHARAAESLTRRGAGVVARAHHVEHAAHAHDEAAIALLTEAAQSLHASAPASAARFYRAVVRLLPDQAQDSARRARLEGALADAQEAAGDAVGARETLLSALGRTEGPSDRACRQCRAVAGSKRRGPPSLADRSWRPAGSTIRRSHPSADAARSD